MSTGGSFAVQSGAFTSDETNTGQRSVTLSTPGDKMLITIAHVKM